MTPRPLEDLAARARRVLIDEYRMKVASLVHLATHSNVLFRVDLADGRRLVLRVSEPLSNTRSNIDLEVAWLSELARDPDLLVVTPVATPDGRLVTDLATGRHGHRPCVLFKWVPGDPMGEGSGPFGYRAMGRLSSQLHGHGDWRPPDPQRLRRWDRTFYYPPQIDPVVIEDFRYDHLFSGRRALLRKAAERSDLFLRRRWAEGEPMVVHGDLHEFNVHLYVGRAWAIDFEDLMLAYPSQDIATSLYGARTRADLDQVIQAFRSGYEEHRPWPVLGRLELEVYWAARQVMLMNHAAQILTQQEAESYFDRVTPWLESFMARLG
ncbi:MAG: phosphotransferase [Acidimicrobiia bacterium]